MKRNHQIELLLPLMLFFVFTLSALNVILFAARVYQETVNEANMNYNANTSLAYVREKIHQHDTAGAITVTDFDSCPAIRMSENIDGQEYVTYIYQYAGALRELFIKAGTEDTMTASSGNEILPIRLFYVDMVSDRLLFFTCTDHDGQKASAYVGIYAEQ